MQDEQDINPILERETETLYENNRDKTLDDKIAAVLQAINKDIRAADLKISLFTAASKNFRHDTCLKPFPPYFIRNGEKDIETVRSTLSTCENLVQLKTLLNNHSYVSKNVQLIELLYFILCTLKEPRLRMVPISNHEHVFKKVVSEKWASRPQYIVKVSYEASYPSEIKWANLSSDKKTCYAYHGSRLENFHSIIHHGLQQHMSKTVVFGSGIYLSSELSVSLPYSPGGTGWLNSGFGSELSCVALCQIIDSHQGVYCQNNNVTGGETSSRVKVHDSMAGEVPYKYYIVSNNDLVRVRYLLLYTKDKPKFVQRSSRDVHPVEVPCRGWFSTYRVLIGYTIMLALIGVATNNNLQYYCRIILKLLEKTLKTLEI